MAEKETMYCQSCNEDHPVERIGTFTLVVCPLMPDNMVDFRERRTGKYTGQIINVGKGNKKESE